MVAVVLFVLSGFPLLIAQGGDDRGDDALLDALVWGAYEPVDPPSYSEAMRPEVADYLRRVRQNCPSIAFRSMTELDMVHTAQVRYACRLAAMSNDRDATRLALGYAVGLHPCYEWEGLHDCPEREAKFADEYHLVHLNGPFRAYLPLLAAHRWLCAAEGYDREGRPAEAYLSRRWYEQRLGAALRSESPLIRTAAAALSDRQQCFATR
jgi:hypothetical protein